MIMEAAGVKEVKEKMKGETLYEVIDLLPSEVALVVLEKTRENFLLPVLWEGKFQNSTLPLLVEVIGVLLEEAVEILLVVAGAQAVLVAMATVARHRIRDLLQIRNLAVGYLMSQTLLKISLQKTMIRRSILINTMKYPLKQVERNARPP
jgi:hypothetical protein